MKFKKDGIIFEVNDPAQIDFFKSHGWAEKTEEKPEAKAEEKTEKKK